MSTKPLISRESRMNPGVKNMKSTSTSVSRKLST
jgi:hypothetical protein